MPELSVIIPTYERRDSLLRTLASLQGQRDVDFEIIVADNACQDELRRAVAAFNATARVPAAYFANPSGDNAGGRNLGAKAARADLLVYTDDDLTFGPHWLRAYRDAFCDHQDMAAAGGRVTPVYEQAPPAWLAAHVEARDEFGVFAKMDLGPEFRLGPDLFFFSCNMAVRRRVFDYTSFHPELYGRKTVGDGEAGMNQEMAQRGEAIGYVPQAEAHHHITQGRMSVAYIMKWAKHCGQSQLYRAWRGRRRTPLALAAGVWDVLRTFARYWVRYPLARGRVGEAELNVQYNAARGLAQLAYLARMTYDPDVRRALDITDFALEALYPGPGPSTQCIPEGAS